MKRIKLYIKLYLISLSAFLVIDMIWIGIFANSFYRNRLGYLLAESPNLAAAVIFYLLFIAGLVFFAVRPGLKKKSAVSGILKSAVFGLMTYGTYDLTNLALIKNWPISVTVVDMIWGMAVSAMVGFISIKLGKHL